MATREYTAESIATGLELAKERGDIVSWSRNPKLSRVKFDVHVAPQVARTWDMHQAHAFLCGLMTGRKALRK